MKWVGWHCAAHGIALRPLSDRHIHLDHRHIQLALKHLRLGYQPDDYAKKLLAGHHNDHFQTHQFASHFHTLAAKYCVSPKAKAGPDGNLRFLMLSTWLYRPQRLDVSLEAMGDLMICPHVGFGPENPHPAWNYPRSWRDKWLPPDELAMAVRAAFAAADDTEVRGACRRCPTDYAVRASKDYVELRVWQDFGPEGSPCSLAWRAQVQCWGRIGRRHRNTFRVGLELHHEPGSVRARYEGPGDEFLKE